MATPSDLKNVKQNQAVLAKAKLVCDVTRLCRTLPPFGNLLRTPLGTTPIKTANTSTVETRCFLPSPPPKIRLVSEQTGNRQNLKVLLGEGGAKHDLIYDFLTIFLL